MTNNIIGINLGCGKKWSGPRISKHVILGIDAELGHKLDENATLDINDNQLDFAYSSHFFEHISDGVALSIFRETYRCLKKDAVFTIIVPDFEELHKKYIENHEMWEVKPYLHPLRGIRKTYPCWKKYDIKPTKQNALLNWFSNYQFSKKGASDWYEGPPLSKLRENGITEEVMEKMLNEKTTKEICDILHKLCHEIKKDFPEKMTLQHINFWNIEKFNKMLVENVGFKSVKKISVETMNNDFGQVKWTNTNPNASLYIEAIK